MMDRMKRALRIVSIVLLLLIAVEVLYLLGKLPRDDRNWIPEQAKTASATIGESIELSNVRDWTYDASGPVTTEWTTASIDSASVVRTWFLLEPFSDWEAVGHTFLSFELTDGRVYSFSVEARREIGETYSAARGLFREYELSYQWGTERDFITRRLIYLDHPLRLYPLALSPEASAALFRSLVEETNRLAERPRFYNTLAANCTNVLATLVNRHYPDTLPFDTSWYLTGYADLYLMNKELIPSLGTNEETQQAYDLTPHRADIMQIATSSPEFFSAQIRTYINN